MVSDFGTFTFQSIIWNFAISEHDSPLDDGKDSGRADDFPTLSIRPPFFPLRFENKIVSPLLAGIFLKLDSPFCSRCVSVSMFSYWVLVLDIRSLFVSSYLPS